MRWTRGLRSQKAYLFIPDDVRLRTWAATIAEERTHSLRRREDARDPDLGEVAAAAGAEEQLSLFAALSSSAIGSHQVEEDDEGSLPSDDELGVLVTLAAAPPLGDAGGDALFAEDPSMPTLDEGPHRTRAEEQRLLRTANAEAPQRWPGPRDGPTRRSTRS